MTNAAVCGIDPADVGMMQLSSFADNQVKWPTGVLSLLHRRYHGPENEGLNGE
jgi:hypothetical protein